MLFNLQFFSFSGMLKCASDLSLSLFSCSFSEKFPAIAFVFLLVSVHNSALTNTSPVFGKVVVLFFLMFIQTI